MNSSSQHVMTGSFHNPWNSDTMTLNGCVTTMTVNGKLQIRATS